MSINQNLAQLSNFFVYGAMTTLTVGMVAFSIALAKGRRLESLSDSVERTNSATAAARMGSTLTLENPAVSTATELGQGRRAGNIGMAVMWLSTALIGFAMIARGLSAGRLPWGNKIGRAHV